MTIRDLVAVTQKTALKPRDALANQDVVNRKTVCQILPGKQLCYDLPRFSAIFAFNRERKDAVETARRRRRIKA